MARPAMKLDFDLDDGYAALGFMNGMATEINTDRYLGSVIDYSHDILAAAFDVHMDTIARSNPSAYHHVYEWRMVGLPPGRLWRHKISGGGSTTGGRVREATFEWRASVRPILTPKERQSDPLGISDPMEQVDSEVIAKLKNRTYFFYNKAPMMEYGLRANVYPKNGKYLFVPSIGTGPKNFYLARHTDQDFSFANPQDHSGGGGTVGKFTTAWVAWWNTVAPTLWDAQVRNTIDNDLGKTEKEMGRALQGRRSRGKSFGIATFNSGNAAFESGKNLAQAYFKGKEQSYRSASRYVDKNGVFGE